MQYSRWDVLVLGKLSSCTALSPKATRQSLAVKLHHHVGGFEFCRPGEEVLCPFQQPRWSILLLFPQEQPSCPAKEDHRRVLASVISHTRQTSTRYLKWTLVMKAENLPAAWPLTPIAFKLGLGELVSGPSPCLMPTST